MIAYVIYANDNGVDAFPLKDDESPEEKYQELVASHGDDYFETDAIFLVADGDKIKFTRRLWLDEMEDDFDEDSYTGL